eukprot:TRINITY_DN1329_c0_g1_i1.p1 TRINITY_DN1329_c0_g1~~TRINITY_DN1329_c0_g1_i1.p1  ORF type:complete len:490 (-),score=174.68 TRINITY_DN1329_c0_g1_i1:120-1589(-)
MLGRSLRLTRTLALGPRRAFSAGEQFDVVVVGAGPGGYVAAIKAAQLGLKTACVEKRATLGGTCLNVGCIPTKSLLNISHHYEHAHKKFGEMGIQVSGLGIDLAKIHKQKDKAVSGLTRGIESLFGKNKVASFKGHGKLTSANTVEVTGQDGKTQTVNAKNIIIATGSEPITLPFLPLDEKVFASSTGALAFPKVPKHLIVLGGGVVGLELGSVWHRLGAEVTVVEFADRIIPTMDHEISTAFQKILAKQGLKFHLKHKVTAGKKVGEEAELQAAPADGGAPITLKADAVLVAIGRRPYTENLGVKEVGVKLDERGRIVTDAHFQSNIKGVYAIGDCVAGPMLAHKAEEEGIACVEHIAGRGGHINYNTIPNVIYTHPEVATVGKTEEELKKEGVKYSKGVFPFIANSRARLNDDYEGLVKILTDKETDRILGIHIIGPSAGEMIAEGVLGMEYGAAAEDIGRTTHAHPTLSEAFKEACMAAYGKPIHF